MALSEDQATSLIGMLTDTINGQAQAVARLQQENAALREQVAAAQWSDESEAATQQEPEVASLTS